MKKLIIFATSLVLALNTFGAQDYFQIGTIKTKDHAVKIYSTDAGTRYTILGNLSNSSNSTISPSKITEAELAERYPDLYKVVAEGIAKDASITPALMEPQNQQYRIDN